MKRISLNAKLDALSAIGVMKQFTLEERIAEYMTYPEEYRAEAINEAREYSAKGFICNQFTLNDGNVDSVIQWQKPLYIC